MSRRISIGCFIIAHCMASRVPCQTLDWTRQLGTFGSESSHGVSADGFGNVYIAGGTTGRLDGVNAGGQDVFLGKYDASGSLEWIRQFGTSSREESTAVSADGLGNVYLAGFTEGGDLGGPFGGGTHDAFLSKFDEHGTHQWTEQIGTRFRDVGRTVAADGLGNVYIGGFTDGNLDGRNAGDADAFLAKYGSDGELVWTRQFGTRHRDFVWSVSIDGLGNAYVAGTSGPSLREDAFLTKYGADGTHQWTQELSSSRTDSGKGVFVDRHGNVYLSGTTWGSLEGSNAGSNDIFLSKYDADGTLQWIDQFGTSEGDSNWGVSADEWGDVYMTGATNGAMDGENAGHRDIYLTKHDANGSFQAALQLGTTETDQGNAISADRLGNVYISGFTGGNLAGGAGGNDAPT